VLESGDKMPTIFDGAVLDRTNFQGARGRRTSDVY